MNRKKRIVFIVDDYYPQYSAVGGCIKNLVDELAHENEIIVIARSQSINSKNIIVDSYKVHYFNTTYSHVRNSIQKKIVSSTNIQKNIFKLAYNILRSYGYVKALVKRENIKKDDVESIYSELIKVSDIDAIIPTCLPFESIIAAIKYKSVISTNTKVIPYLFDKYSDNKSLHRLEINRIFKFNNHLNLEKNILNKCDKILYVEAWESHILKYLPEIKNKSVLVEHPLIKKNNSEIKNEFDKNKINFVYTGALYKKIRSPILALKVFEKLILTNTKVVVHFFITGDCSKFVQYYSDKHPNNIINYGAVDTDIAKSVISQGDILVSIGNTDITQLPSKIYDYISTGNSIIHFYYDIDDPTNKILSRYRNAICMPYNDDSVETIINALKNFIEDKNDKVTFDEIEKIYLDSTPRYITELIKNEL